VGLVCMEEERPGNAHEQKKEIDSRRARIRMRYHQNPLAKAALQEKALTEEAKETGVN